MSVLRSSRRKYLFPVLGGLCLALTTALVIAAAGPLALRNAGSLRLLADPQADIGASSAGAYLRGVVALNRGDADLALDLLRQADQDSPLVRGETALALARSTGNWHGAAVQLAAEQPLPHYLLAAMLRPHIGELTPAELDFWRERLRSADPLLLIDLALELLIQGKNDQAEQWARALPAYAVSAEARRIVAQAHLNRGQYPEAVALFQELYGEDASALNAYWVGRALLLDGRYAESVAALEQAVATTDRDLGWYQADLGLAYGLAGDCARARATIDLALGADAGADGAERAEQADLAARIAQVQETVDSVCP